MFKSNLAKYRKQLHLGEGGYGDQAKVGLRPAELGVYVDGEAVFEAAPDGQEAFRIVQRKREVILMSYNDLNRWKDNFKEECYQEWLARASPGGLDESAVTHMIRINNKQLADDLAIKRRKVSDLTDRMSKMESIVAGVASQSLNAELTAKASAAATTQLRVESEARHKEHCLNTALAQEESSRLRGELREVKSKAADDTATLLATILDRMDRQERNMEERMDRLQHQPRQETHGVQRNGPQGRGQSSHISDAHQAGGRRN